MTEFIAIHSFYMKLVNYSAYLYKFLIYKIDKLDEKLKNREETNAIQKEIKYFVNDHVDALE